MGIGFVQRETWLEAAKLVQAQDQWDCMNSSKLTNAPRPENIEYAALAAILRGQVIHTFNRETLL